MLEIPSPITILSLLGAIGVCWKIIKSFDEIRLEFKDGKMILEIKHKKITFILRKGESKAESSCVEDSDSTHQEDTHTLLEPQHKASHTKGQALKGSKKNRQEILVGKTLQKL